MTRPRSQGGACAAVAFAEGRGGARRKFRPPRGKKTGKGEGKPMGHNVSEVLRAVELVRLAAQGGNGPGANVERGDRNRDGARALLPLDLERRLALLLTVAVLAVVVVGLGHRGGARRGPLYTEGQGLRDADEALLGGLRSVFPNVRALPPQVQLVQGRQRVVHGPEDLWRREPIYERCHKGCGGQGDRYPDGVVRGTKPDAYAQDQHEEAVQHHPEPGHRSHPLDVVPLQRSHAHLHVGLCVDRSSEVLLVGSVQQRAPRVHPAPPQHVPQRSARVAHRLDAVERVPDLQVQRLQVHGQGARLLHVAVAPHQVLLPDAGHGQALHHVPQALQEALLVHGGRGAVGRDVAEEEVDLRDNPTRAHVDAGPGLAELEAPLYRHEEQDEDGEHH
mmetsp:Transcript_83781/g.260345  ORF Transcript_83781/g.260345 Transcript_83781/m.260345 type:complete len:391 (-) Transcript_83781:1623-2795(-)